MYLITIIMPVYNAEQYLKRSINSIINQTIGFDNIELILVDDNSSDSSKEIIKEYSKIYSNIKPFFSEKNHGFPGFGRNIGLKNASAEYIMFIDNDDEYEKDFCEKVYNIIKFENCDVVMVNYNIYNNNSTTIQKDYFSRYSSEYNDQEVKLIKLNKFRNITSTTVWSKIFKKSIIKDNNLCFVEDKLNEDSLFLYDYYYYSDNLILLNYFGYKHYRHGTNRSYYSSKVTFEYLNSYYDILNLVKEKYGEIDTNYLFKDKIQTTLFDMIFTKHQKCLLEKLYDFEKEINFNTSLDHPWWSLVNTLLLKKRFFIVRILLKLTKILKITLDFLRSFKIKNNLR